jgi:hypothetical protein
MELPYVEVGTVSTQKSQWLDMISIATVNKKDPDTMEKLLLLLMCWWK